MIAFIRKYAKAIVAGIGYTASIAAALGLTHYHWVSVILGALSTIAVILTRNTVTPASPPGGGTRVRSRV
jgi:hypothetical protein